MISIRTHNFLDYAFAGLLLIAPYLLGLSPISFARDAFVVSGLGMLGYSLLSDYSYSVARVLPFPSHLMLDVITGLFVIAAPFIYGYQEELAPFQFVGHFAFGLGIIGLPIITQRGDIHEPAAAGQPTISNEQRPIAA